MRAIATLTATLLALSGCARCGAPREQGAPPERWLPASAPFAVVLPELGRGAEQLAALARAARSYPAAGSLMETVDGLRSQLGFDPLDRRGLEAAGFDPARGAALAAGPGQPLVLVMPIADERRFEDTLTRLARDRTGATARGRATSGAVTVEALRKDPGGPPVLAFAYASRYALLATGPSSEDAVRGAAGIAQAESLAASAPFAEARDAAGRDQAALFWAPPASAAVKPVALLRDGLLVGARASDRLLALRAVLPLSPERAVVWREVAGVDRRAGAAELALLPEDALLAARFGGDPSALGRRVGYALPAAARERLAVARVDLSSQLWDQLAPGAAVSLSLAPSFDVAHLSARGWEYVLSDPFRLLHLTFAARVKEPSRLEPLVARLPELARALGFGSPPPAAPARAKGRPARGAAAAKAVAAKAAAPSPPQPPARPLPPGAVRLPWGGDALTVALRGDRLLAAGGPGRFEALLARVEGQGAGYAAPSPGARDLLRDGPGALVLDPGNLVRSARALPPEAYGTGPDGFVMRSLAERFVEPASHLKSIAVRLEVREKAALLDLAIEGEPPQAAEPASSPGPGKP
ncbi:hypothetical protein [Anaeromyxobacter paludicola]|uniref:Lipoprotein n=1 Tax=Anaeromyxobacter paludicola TaxID=2918171 RepID=A0ABM7XEK5_9BACT|nr:hypothetical protein [Anaeromyxobacter paludicola]BDG10288.1 hypothetical protein AMPC_34010 [Anaeromyxobacter paludicola]